MRFSLRSSSPIRTGMSVQRQCPVRGAECEVLVQSAECRVCADCEVGADCDVGAECDVSAQCEVSAACDVSARCEV